MNNPFRIVVAHPATSRSEFALNEVLPGARGRAEFVLNPHDDARLTVGELAELLADADALITGWGSGPVAAEAYARAGRLKIVALMGSSLKNIAPEAAWARGAIITNTARAVGQSVAEYTLGVALSLLHGFDAVDATLKQGDDWRRAQAACSQSDLADQRVGLVGLGAVGVQVAAMMRCFGAEVGVYDPFAPDSRLGSLGLARFGTLRELLGASDVVSLHAGLTPETHHMIGRPELEAMKPGAILINTARGGLIDEKALVDAARAGRIRAALDVYETEPLPPDHPLRSLPNVLLSPHVAGYCNRSTYRRCARTAVEDVLRVAAGEQPQNVVTPEMHARAT